MAATSMTRRDKLIPWYFVAAFLLLFVIDGTMAAIAIHTRRGEVIDKAYERGLAYNHYIKQAEEQAARGWKGSLTQQGNQIRFDLHGKDGAPLNGAEVKVSFRRAAFEGQDFELPLAETAPGVYVRTVSFPGRGQWLTEVSATWQQKPYILQQTIFVP